MTQTTYHLELRDTRGGTPDEASARLALALKNIKRAWGFQVRTITPASITTTAPTTPKGNRP